VRGRYAKLASDWLLRGWVDEPYALVNYRNGSTRILSKKQLYVLISCDGKSNFDSYAFLPIHLALLEEFIQESIVVECSRGDEADTTQMYRCADSPYIEGVEWSITGRCNLNCLHCYMESPSGKYGEPSFRDVAAIIDQFEQANVISVMLTGGEPFMRSDILDAITLLAKKKIRISYIFTNGLLLNEEKLMAIRQLGIAPVFQVSFDGVGAHDYMRGADGTEPDVIDSIRLLRRCGFHVVVSTSVDNKSVNTLLETYECMKELGIGYWRITSPQESGNWTGTSTQLSLEDEDRYLSPILECWLQDQKPFGIQLGGFYRSDIVPTENHSRPKYTLDSFDCGTCKSQSYLLPNGTLLPCAGYVGSEVEAKMPNLFKQNLREIWSDSYLQELSNLKKRDVIDSNQECAACEMFDDCGMGCRVSALIGTGDIMAKDLLSCKLWKDGYKERYKKRVQDY